MLLQKLGAGGMGAVFAAYDEKLDRKVALKLLHSAELEQSVYRERVLREAQAMARVSHPNVVQVYDVGEIGERIFIAMEYIEGMTLDVWEEQPRSWQETLRVYRQAGEGLHAAHQTGLVHRDFKPANVLIDRDGRVRVVDFGLARLQVGQPEPAPPAASSSGGSQTSRPAAVTGVGDLVGTPGYMSPEQFCSEATDHRSDQFSFCVALYEALYHCRPFAGDSLADISANVVAGRLQAPPLGLSIPIEIGRAIERGLAIEPSRRFSDMTELLRAMAVDVERDPAGAGWARWRLSVALIVATVLINTLVVFTQVKQRALTVRDAVIVMAVMVAFFAGGAVVFRRSLMKNTFHRALSFRVLLTLVSLLGERYIGLLLKLDLIQLYPIDLVMMGGFVATIALDYLPEMWLSTASMIAAAFASVRWPQYAPLFANTAYLIVPIVWIQAWKRAAARSLTKSVH